MRVSPRKKGILGPFRVSERRTVRNAPNPVEGSAEPSARAARGPSLRRGGAPRAAPAERDEDADEPTSGARAAPAGPSAEAAAPGRRGGGSGRSGSSAGPRANGRAATYTGGGSSARRPRLRTNGGAVWAVPRA